MAELENNPLTWSFLKWQTTLMTEANISPVAARVIAKCGGREAAAALARVSVNYVYRWTYEKERGGLSGRVPDQARRNMLDAALRGEVSLTPADFEEGWS